jgi:hypothetical protein
LKIIQITTVQLLLPQVRNIECMPIGYTTKALITGKDGAVTRVIPAFTLIKISMSGTASAKTHCWEMLWTAGILTQTQFAQDPRAPVALTT